MAHDHEPTVLYETVHGSRAYGLAQEGSDTDLKGVVVGPSRWYFGFRGGPEQVELHADHVRYELRKLLRLVAKANPTVLEILFTEPEDHRVMTPWGERLLAERERFLTRRVAGSFGGYAMQQLRRIETHRRWLLHPPKARPSREAFGLPERKPIPRDQLGAIETLIERGEAPALSESFLEVLAREKRYRSAKKEWDQFCHWKKARNPERAALEAEHGYDTKHAMHLIRLQRMAVEILESGEVIVRRPDRDSLMAIRRGALSYDALIEEARENGDRIRAAAERSALPDDPDEEAIEALGIAIIEEVLASRRKP